MCRCVYAEDYVARIRGRGSLKMMEFYGATETNQVVSSMDMRKQRTCVDEQIDGRL